MRGNPNQCAAEMRRRARALATEIKISETVSANVGKRIAVSLSQGPYSSEMLAAMGHPYSKRRPNPPMPTYIINTQTGEFARSWKAEASRLNGSSLRARVLNTDPKGPELEAGPFLAIARPMAPQIAKLLKPIRTRLLREAVRKALKI